MISITKNLMVNIYYTIRLLQNPGEWKKDLIALGERHFHYNVQEYMTKDFANLTVEIIRYYIDDVTEKELENWRKIYEFEVFYLAKGIRQRQITLSQRSCDEFDVIMDKVAKDQLSKKD